MRSFRSSFLVAATWVALLGGCADKSPTPSGTLSGTNPTGTTSREEKPSPDKLNLGSVTEGEITPRPKRSLPKELFSLRPEAGFIVTYHDMTMNRELEHVFRLESRLDPELPKYGPPVEQVSHFLDFRSPRGARGDTTVQVCRYKSNVDLKTSAAIAKIDPVKVGEKEYFVLPTPLPTQIFQFDPKTIVIVRELDFPRAKAAAVVKSMLNRDPDKNTVSDSEWDLIQEASGYPEIKLENDVYADSSRVKCKDRVIGQINAGETTDWYSSSVFATPEEASRAKSDSAAFAAGHILEAAASPKEDVLDRRLMVNGNRLVQLDHWKRR